ncbi:hypothetical protein [Nocardia wallacei]|uniref:hypothetical protein n=1 Tax=Nocardia wallacei TaxID=480035 RepID=UPI002456A99D|nr:hypothetical protein [Nocardia wallacei]
MPEIPTAADKLAAVALVADMADKRGSRITDDILADLHADAGQQLVEDRSIGDTLLALDGIGPHLALEQIGAIVRAAVEGAGGRLVFGDAPAPAEPPTGHAAPGNGTQDQAPDRARDVYDEIRAERVGAVTPTWNAERRGVSARDLTIAAIRVAEGSHAKSDPRTCRKQLVHAAALLAAAIEVMDRDA